MPAKRKDKSNVKGKRKDLDLLEYYCTADEKDLIIKVTLNP